MIVESMEEMDSYIYDKPEKTLEVIESWCTSNHKEFFFNLKSLDTIPAGLYNLCYSQTNGYGVQKLNHVKEDFIMLPSSPHEKIIEGIEKFWANKKEYIKYGLSPKRGVILYGDAGCGKSSCVYLVIDKIKNDQNGIAVYFNNPDNWIEVARMIRKIEKERPLLCIIEDLDLVILKYGEDTFLNFLDGLNSVDNVVYIATTNNINNISDRIKNRPSRFDVLYQIKKPTVQDAEVYFTSMVLPEDIEIYSIAKLAKDTKGFSMAHLRETFISLYIMKSDYTETITRLKHKKIADTPSIGFGSRDDED